MAEIIQWSTGFTDKGLALTNEEFVRTLYVGSTWTKIRLGIHFSPRTQAVSMAGVQFILGLCSGKTNPYNAGSTTNFVGVTWAGFGAVSGNLNSYFGPPYFVYSNGNSILKRVGSTTTMLGLNSSAIIYMCLTEANQRGMLFLDITKGSPNYTFSTFYSTFSAKSTSEFWAAFTTDSVPPPGCSTGINAQSAAFDESAGALDTFDLYWNQSVMPLDVWYMGANRLIV